MKRIKTLFKSIYNAIAILFSGADVVKVVKPTTYEEAIKSLIILVERIKLDEPEAMTAEEFARRARISFGFLKDSWGLRSKDSALYGHMKERFFLEDSNDIFNLLFMCTFQVIRGYVPTPEKFAASYRGYWEQKRALSKSVEKVLEDSTNEISLTMEDLEKLRMADKSKTPKEAVKKQKEIEKQPEGYQFFKH